MPVGPACRYPDPITHDMVTPSGTTVPLPSGPDPQPTLIEGLPAAHMMHGALCSGVIAAGLAHPPLPVPVPIVLGSPTVFIGNMPAARWAPSMDTAGCGVFLGNSALAATRTTLIGDGGGAVPPLPIKMAVFLNGQWVMQIGRSIFVFPDPGNPGYQGQVAEAYERLNQLSPTFRRSLAAIDATPHALIVKMYNGSAGKYNSTTGALGGWPDVLPKGAVRTIGGKTYTGNGNGASSVIEWDPAVNGNGIVPGQPGSDQQGSDVIIAHETDHGARNATAQHDPGYFAPGGTQTDEERATTGLPAQVYNGAPGDPNNGAALPDTTGLPYTENGTRDDYRNAGVNAPYDPGQNPGPPQPAPTRPSYYPNAAGAPF